MKPIEIEKEKIVYFEDDSKLKDLQDRIKDLESANCNQKTKTIIASLEDTLESERKRAKNKENELESSVERLNDEIEALKKQMDALDELCGRQCLL
jgi:predicted  nucleic acid-binding Zn-ribbon protein